MADLLGAHQTWKGSMGDEPGTPAWLEVTGATVHNLKSVSVRVPHGKVVAFTGRSGSGKSSLVIDTVLAEATRRSAQAMSAYARQFVQQFERPPFATMTGLCTAVYLEQGRVNRNPRSTLGTMTDLYDGLRLLMARFGVPDCPACLRPMSRRAGIWTCPDDESTEQLLDPKDFSFNLPFGACRDCDGLGTQIRPALSRMVDRGRPVADGALLPFETDRWRTIHRDVASQIVADASQDPTAPFETLPRDVQDQLLTSIGRPVTMRPDGGAPFETQYVGPAAWVEEQYRTAATEGARARLAPFLTTQVCAACRGSRLGPAPRRYRLAGASIPDLTAMALPDLSLHLSNVRDGGDHDAAAPVLDEAIDVVDRLTAIGLGYLTLSRATPTLSGGEEQRARLAMQLSSQLFGVMHVLDEPSAGLHPIDVQRLATSLKDLASQGNTVLVVEHDPALIQSCDWMVDMGPGPGDAGGQVLFSGPPARVTRGSVTGPYLTETPPVSTRVPRVSREFLTVTGATANNVTNVTVDLPIGALTCIVGVSGSGKSSFVDHVLRPALAQAGVDTSFDGAYEGTWSSLSGANRFSRVRAVDQAPIGRTPRSNPATYSGAFDILRKEFAATPQARSAHLGAKHFSFNLPDGRCETCNGDGSIRIEMGFHPDVFVTCDGCGGARYQDRVLAVLVDGLNIADVLGMSVNACAQQFAERPALVRALEPLQRVGLGYVKLGQPAPALSGGEAQRLKIARELTQGAADRTLYLLDEPSTGLHPVDVDDLIGVIHDLVDLGGTAVVIEHDPRFIAAADWLVEFGPGSGSSGGHVIGLGSPRAVVNAKESVMGPFVRPYLR